MIGANNSTGNVLLSMALRAYLVHKLQNSLLIVENLKQEGNGLQIYGIDLNTKYHGLDWNNAVKASEQVVQFIENCKTFLLEVLH